MSGPVLLWRIATDTPNYVSEDLSGEGARVSGGRWNRPGGAPVVYAATSRALACLETIVHLEAQMLPLNRYLVEIAIPNSAWEHCAQANPEDLPGWNALPPGKVSLDWGDAWLAGNSTLLARVPSVVVPEEWCVLVNPRHPQARELRAHKVRKWTYDSRLYRHGR